MSVPLVSVVVPARDAEATLRRLLRALMPQVGAREDAEAIVVDNGSRDRTRELAAAAGARVLTEARPGAAAARNAGIKAARGRLIAFLDSDCIPRPGWLDALVRALADAPGIGAVGGRIVAAPSTNLLQRHAEHSAYISQEEGFRDPFLPYLLTANCCYRADALHRLDGFDERLRSGEDTDVSWRMQLRLGLGVALAADAVVEHVHRATVRGLWRQWVRYGWSGIQLDARFPDRPRAVPERAQAVRARRLAGVTKSLRALVLLPAGCADPLDALTPALRALELAAMHVGRRQARRSLRSERLRQPWGDQARRQSPGDQARIGAGERQPDSMGTPRERGDGGRVS